jgi:formate dehydrogenase major subunit
MVTRRAQTLVVAGRTIHQVGLPIHWGFAGETVGGIANDLTALLAEPNASIHEGKVFVCQVQAGRMAGAIPQPTVPPGPWPSRDPMPETPPAAQPEGRFSDGS